MLLLLKQSRKAILEMTINHTSVCYILNAPEPALQKQENHVPSKGKRQARTENH